MPVLSRQAQAVLLPGTLFRLDITAAFDYTLKDALRQVLPNTLPITNTQRPATGGLAPLVAGYMLRYKTGKDISGAGVQTDSLQPCYPYPGTVSHVVQWRAQEREDMDDGVVAIDTRAQRTPQVLHERSLSGGNLRWI